MGISLQICIVYAIIVQWVDTNLAMGMNDLAFGQNDANMDDLALVIGKESEVSRPCFCHQLDQITKLGLLISITWQVLTKESIDDLDESRTIDTEGRSTTPEVGST